MLSDPIVIEHLPAMDDYNTLRELYATYETHSSSPNLSPSPSSPRTKAVAESLADQRKDCALKLPYPVLADHREPSSILVVLQKETHATSKKISNVTKQIDECERRLTSAIHTDNDKKTFKHDRVKFKQQLDALKKHERRVSLQIDFITTRTEISGLEDEHKQLRKNTTSDENQQIRILLRKLKQKLEKMKIYMKARNEEMKRISNGKQRANPDGDRKASSLSSSQRPQGFKPSTTTDMNRKRTLPSMNRSAPSKRTKPATPIIRLTSRATNEDSSKQTVLSPVVRFVNKTGDFTMKSASPASSASTLSPPLLSRSSTGCTQPDYNSTSRNAPPPVNGNDDDDDDDDDDELHLELNIDELFEDDPYTDQVMQRRTSDASKLPCPLPVTSNVSTTQS